MIDPLKEFLSCTTVPRAGVVELANYGIHNESIICFGGEDWWYHHPHSKKHILKRLAHNNKVLFVNSLTMGLPPMSSPDLFLKIRRKLKSQTRWLKKAPEGLHVMTPVALPLYGSRAARALNRVILASQIRIAMRLCGMRDPIIWAAIPSAVDVVEALRAKLVFYQVSDKYDAQEDSALAISKIHDFDHRLKQMAAVVLYSGRRLYEEATEPHRYFLEQAVDFDHFASDVPDTAPDVVDIPHPVLGFMGGIGYTMDAALVQQVSEQRPDWHWVFVGNKSNLCTLNAPNVHFLGPRSYADLPAYIRHWDVCVLPWRSEHKFVQYGSAIKVREYLATGKPVVICPMHEFQSVPGVRVYHSVDEFMSLVEDALTSDTAEAKRLRQGSVKNSTWDDRAREIGLLMSAGLKSREELAARITSSNLQRQSQSVADSADSQRRAA